MKKIALLFLSLILISLSFSMFLINNVNATTTYNWIQNSGFDDSGGNLINNGGFETGSLNPWTSFSGTPTVDNANPHSGTYCVLINADNDCPKYSFTSDIPVANFNLTGYVKSNRTANLNAYVYYNDSSYTVQLVSGGILGDNAYHFVTFTTALDAGKSVSYFYIIIGQGAGAIIMYIDDIAINISGSGQTAITPTTTPWFCDMAVGTHYPDIVMDTFNTGPNSCYFEIGSQHYDALMQMLSNLDSDSATSFTLYALDASGSGGATLDVKLHYSDGSWSSSTPTAITGSWAEYNFTYLIVPHKIIDKIYIKPTDYSGSDIYVDTISLLSTNPVTYISFSFDLSPSALWINYYPSGYRLMEFGSFENQAYVATCTMYNNSIPTGNGTFLVTSSLASYSGIILNGIFSFNIAQRSIPINNTIELFNIDINSNLFNTSVTIRAYWYKLDSGIPENQRATEKANQFTDALPIILIMALFIIPATYYLGVGGFIGGFSIGAIVCVWTGLAPSWFIAIVVLTDLVMIFFATREHSGVSLSNKDDEE